MEEKSAKRSALHDVVACILPIVSLVAALGVAAFVFRRVDSSVTAAQAELAKADQAEGAVVEQQAVYGGVEDPWIEAGTFTVGDEELDAHIRDFCNSYTYEGATADEAAHETYDAIVTSTYLYRVDKPMGLDWVARSAREYFNSDDGMGGHQGDVYEFASVLALCLRYFGFGDAIAVPIVNTTGVGDADGSALCLVTSSDGVACVCDPSVGTAGWMLPRTSYQILVDDIGQNKDAVEALGLEVQEKYADEEGQTADGQTDMTGTSEYGSADAYSSGTGTSSTSGSGTSGTSATGGSGTSGSATSGTGTSGTSSSGANGSSGSYGGSGGYDEYGDADGYDAYGSYDEYGSGGSYGSSEESY